METLRSSKATQIRLTRRIEFNSRLKEYGTACFKLGAGTINPGYVDEQLHQLKVSLQHLIAAAQDEGRGQIQSGV